MSLMDLFTGDFLSRDEDREGREAMEKAAGAFNGMTPPKLSPLEFDRYGYAGDIEAEQVDAGPDVSYLPIEARPAMLSEMGPTAFDGISSDPRLRDSQMASMSALDDIASSGGMNAQDRANLSRIQSQTSTADRGRRQAIQQGMASRGMGGSGMDLMAQLQSSQAATDQHGQQGLDVAGMAQSRALDAMMQSGQMAGNVRGQDWQQDSDRASARDRINSFNTQNRNRNSEFNVGQQNNNSQFNAGNQLSTALNNRNTNLGAAQWNAGARMNTAEGNRAGRQGIMKSNTELGNRQLEYNGGLGQQDFQNQMAIAGGKQRGAGIGMNYWENKGNKKRDAWGNIIQGGIMVGATAMAGPAGGVAAGAALNGMAGEDDEVDYGGYA